MTFTHEPILPRPDDAVDASNGGAGSAGLPEGLVGDWGAIDPLVLAAVGATGVVLLLFGARILRPAVVLGAASMAALIGLRLAAASRADLLPGWIQGIGIPPVAWVIALPLLGGLLAAVVARLALAVLLGIAVATLVLVLGLVVAGGGGSVGEETVAASISWRQELAPEPTDRTSDQITDQISDQIADQVTETMRDRLGDMAEGLVSDLPELDPELPEGVEQWWREMTTDLPPATLDLVVALATVSGICAVLLGLLLPERVAMVGTALAGAWLMAAAATGVWARFGSGTPPPVVSSIIAAAVLACLGMAFQAKTAPKASRGSGRRSD